MQAPELSFHGTGDGVEGALVDHQPIRISCMPVPGALAASLSVGDEVLGAPSTRLGEHMWHWEWHPRGRAGAFMVRLTVRHPQAPELARDVRLLVAPGKLGLAEYDQLLAAIQRAAAGLVYALHGGASGVTTGTFGEGPAALIEEYWTRLMAETEAAGVIVRALSRASPGVLQTYDEEQPFAEVSEPMPQSLARIAERPLDEVAFAVGAPLNRLVPGSRRGIAHVPRDLAVRRNGLSNDRYEHRLLARTLRELHGRCAYLRETLAREINWRSRATSEGTSAAVQGLQIWRHHVDAMARRLTRYRAADFLEGVPAGVVWRGPSERMRRNPHYRRIAQLWRLVHERPFVAVHSPAFALPLNDIPTLYEQWCLLEVARVLPSCGTIVDQDLLRHEGATEPDGGAMNWHVRIGENRPLLRIARSDGKHLALWYRRRYKPDEGHGERLGSLDPFLRVPDIVIEVTGAGAVPAVLVFDAKYRVSPAGGIPEDALADAYTYHQALGYGGQQVSRGAFLLFPGEAGFVAGDVGAVALVPGRTAGLWALLTQRLAAM